MEKTLKTNVEGYSPRSGDEKRFIDKHIVAQHSDRNGNGDEVFKAKKMKTIRRMIDRHGYDVGKDHEVYESENKSVTINKPGHKLHGTKASVFYDHGDGRLNVQIRSPYPGNRKVTNLTLKSGEYKLNESLDLSESTKVVTKKYNWGTMKTIHQGSSFSIPLHPEHHEPISKLKDGESHRFTDETRQSWTATRKGDSVHFLSHSQGYKAHVPVSSLKEETLSESTKARTGHFAFTHTPGDEESERKLAYLKELVKKSNKESPKEFGLRVIAKGRMGKNNPNAEKYKKAAKDPNYRSWGGSHPYQTISLGDAKHHDIYIHRKPYAHDIVRGSNQYWQYYQDHKKLAGHVVKQFKKATGGLNESLKGDQLDEHRGYKSAEIDAAGYKFKSHLGGSEPTTLYHHPELDKHIEIRRERTGISGAKKRHVFYSGKFGSHSGGMQTRHLNLNDAIRKNNGELKEETENLGEARNVGNFPSHLRHKPSYVANPSAMTGDHHTTPEQRKAAKAKKWKSVSFQHPDGRWGTKDVYEVANPSAMTGDHHTTPEQRKAAKAKKWKSVSFQHPDGRWGTKDVYEEAQYTKYRKKKIKDAEDNLAYAMQRAKEDPNGVHAKVLDNFKNSVEHHKSMTLGKKKPNADHFAMHHTPGDEDSEKKLNSLKKMVRDHNATANEHEKLRVRMRGRLGKGNEAGRDVMKMANHRFGVREVPMKHATYSGIYVVPKPNDWRNDKRDWHAKEESAKAAREHAKRIVAAHKSTGGLNESLKGDQHKIDANGKKSAYQHGYDAWIDYKKGKSKSYPKNPFKPGSGTHEWERGAEAAYMSEESLGEAEQLDELSKDTLASYKEKSAIHGAISSAIRDNMIDKVKRGYSYNPSIDTLGKNIAKRVRGIKLADKKLRKK